MLPSPPAKRSVELSSLPFIARPSWPGVFFGGAGNLGKHRFKSCVPLNAAEHPTPFACYFVRLLAVTD